jgi:hypothetical protein
MNAIEKHVIERIQSVQIESDPFPHFFVDNIFPQDFYDEILAQLPSPAEFDCDDPHRLNFYLNLKEDGLARLDSNKRDFWENAGGWIRGEQFRDSLASKFYPYLKLRFFDRPNISLGSTASLTRNKSGYILGPHTDMKHRVLTLIFYLPQDDQHWEVGTSIYKARDNKFTCPGGPHHGFENFQKLATIRFIPNMAFGFLKSDTSFHGVEPWSDENFARDTLQYEIHDSDRSFYYGSQAS